MVGARGGAAATGLFRAIEAMPTKTPTKEELKARLAEVEAELERIKVTAPVETASQTPEKFLCPITYARMRSPVVCADGQVFERSAIERWLMTNPTNPATGAPLAHRYLNPTLTLRNEILEFEDATQRQRPAPSPTPRPRIDPTLEAAPLRAAQIDAIRREARLELIQEQAAVQREGARIARERIAMEAAARERERQRRAAEAEAERERERQRRLAEEARRRAEAEAERERQRQAQVQREQAADANKQRGRLSLRELPAAEAIAWQAEYKAQPSYAARINLLRRERGDAPLGDEDAISVWNREMNRAAQQRAEAASKAKQDKAARRAERRAQNRNRYNH